MLIRPGVVDFRGRDLGRQSYGSPRQIVSETCTEWRLLRMQSTISVDVRVEEKEEHQKLKDGSAIKETVYYISMPCTFEHSIIGVHRILDVARLPFPLSIKQECLEKKKTLAGS